MANQRIDFYNWYRRYKVRAVDMLGLQKGLVDSFRGMGEGAFGKAVMSGLEVTSAGGLVLNISEGIAQGASGQLIAASGGAVTGSADGSLPVKSLIVARALVESENYITRPTNPFEPVPLNEVQCAQIVLLTGTPAAQPEYPTVEDTDAVLAGFTLAAGQSSITEEELDFDVRESIGKNTPVMKNTFRFDDRLRPYRLGPTSIGIKPSQTLGSNPKLMLETGQGQPSIFPKTSGGDFNPSDTNLDFSTGAITGGDEQSADFTPQTPTGANAIVATVQLTTNDTLAVSYGTQGTFAQCLEGIRSQKTAGAGSIAAAPGTYKVCYVIVRSHGGSISDVFLVDARSLGAASSGGGGGDTYTQFLFNNNQASPANVTGFLLDSNVSNSFEAVLGIRRTVEVPSTGEEDAAFYAALTAPGDNSGFDGQVLAVGELSDGSLIVGGNFSNLNGVAHGKIAKLDPDGTPNATFTANIGTGFGAVVRGIEIQSDDSIVVTGNFTSFDGNTCNYIARLDSDGNLDTAFMTNIGAGFNDNTIGLAIQADGKILVGGVFNGASGFNGNNRNRLVRLNSDGTEDTAFYTNLGTGFNSGYINKILVQTDQKILVGGDFTALDGTTRNRFVRLNTNGTVDTTFYTNMGAAFNASVVAIGIQSDGKILVGGQFTQFDGNTRGYFTRLNSTGTEDADYVAAIDTGFDDQIGFNGISVQPDDAAIVGGAFLAFNSFSRTRLVRITSAGEDDAEFYAQLGVGSFDAYINNVRVLSDGAVFVGGTFVTLSGDTRNYAVKLVPNEVAELNQTAHLHGAYNVADGAWRVSELFGSFEDAGLTFTMTAGGQLQYVSSNYPAQTTGVMRFLIRRL